MQEIPKTHPRYVSLMMREKIFKAMKEGKTTADIGGNLGTTQGGEFVCQTIRKLAG